jgi:hypothetical protein
MSNVILGGIGILFVLLSIWFSLVVHHRWGRKK